ncbi:cysteine methyltransferase [Candidatus Falkowbacteria bacterium HGW-Falkowbacteria-2]|uniref:Cysteine methyltransferase n=1 Tax=Candidatus Falkowbacteria bacterium HGW-Falkowbacteria-2 TaxID=2013769 RepID=A0A2N2DZL4_9BACT|nr:MAG: cysteine methyltransferase [Candidatus Falkowbacteria bacterium HGW-Falkowbacteria-2]
MSINNRHKVSDFASRVYELTSKVPKGKVTTYGRLAALLDLKKGAQAVGQALHCNPFAPTVPCHRVVRSDGDIGGFAFGTDSKKKLLKSEGVEIINNKIDLSIYCVK